MSVIEIIGSVATIDHAEYLINIDSGVVNAGTDYINATFVLEQTGITIDDRFLQFSEYSFLFDQNQRLKIGNMVYCVSDTGLNADHVRLQDRSGTQRVGYIRSNLFYFGTPGPQHAVLNIQPRTHRRPVKREQTLALLSKDRQNVHDTTILDRFKAVYDMAMNMIDITLLNRDKVKNDLLMVNNPKCDPVVIDHIYSTNGYIQRLDCCEVMVLGVVHAVLKKKNLGLDLLISNLNDCMEYGGLVCLTGRVTRMLNSIEHLFNPSGSASDHKDVILSMCAKLFSDGLSYGSLISTVKKEFSGLDGLDEMLVSWKIEDMY